MTLLSNKWQRNEYTQAHVSATCCLGYCNGAGALTLLTGCAVSSTRESSNANCHALQKVHVPKKTRVRARVNDGVTSCAKHLRKVKCQHHIIWGFSAEIPCFVGEFKLQHAVTTSVFRRSDCIWNLKATKTLLFILKISAISTQKRLNKLKHDCHSTYVIACCDTNAVELHASGIFSGGTELMVKIAQQSISGQHKPWPFPLLHNLTCCYRKEQHGKNEAAN